MQTVKVNQENEQLLFQYMKTLEGKTPYYFETSDELLKEYIWNDTLKEHALMESNNIFLAIEANKTVGMIQFGEQSVDFNEKGEFLISPHTGNIRLLFFENKEAGQQLLNLANQCFNQLGIDEVYAFNHVAGLSCHSKHGKLHESMGHVHELLKDNGFSERHENVYYVLDKEGYTRLGNSVDANLRLNIEHGVDRDHLKLIHQEEDKIIGIGEVTKLSLWSKNVNDPNLYMRYIVIDKSYRGQGYSKKMIAMIANHYQSQGIETIHTDTSLYNPVAQNLYSSLGFQNGGITRDYKRSSLK